MLGDGSHLSNVQLSSDVVDQGQHWISSWDTNICSHKSTGRLQQVRTPKQSGDRTVWSPKFATKELGDQPLWWTWRTGELTYPPRTRLETIRTTCCTSSKKTSWIAACKAIQIHFQSWKSKNVRNEVKVVTLPLFSKCDRAQTSRFFILGGYNFNRGHRVQMRRLSFPRTSLRQETPDLQT